MKRLALWEDPFGLSPVEPDTAGMLRMSKPVLRKLEGPVLSKAEWPDGSPFDALRVSG